MNGGVRRIDVIISIIKFFNTHMSSSHIQQAKSVIKDLLETSWPAPFRVSDHLDVHGPGVGVRVLPEHSDKCIQFLKNVKVVIDITCSVYVLRDAKLE